MLRKLQNVVNWVLPPIIGGSIYVIVFIAGRFNPEIFSWEVICIEIAEIAILFFLVRKFLNYKFKKEGIEVLNWKTFLIAFLIIQVANLVFYFIIKNLLIIFTNQIDSISFWHISLVFAEGVLCGLLLVGIQFMLLFFKGWNDSKVKAEQLEKENTKTKLASLKLQLNPHFLFNNFHTLDGLIHEDQKEASSFLLELSGLYRSILKYSNDEVILLKKELELVNHFNYLMEKRFSKNFQCEIRLSEALKNNYYVPPMSIQLLLENIVKHNRIDNQYPLRCTIENEGEYIVVKNKLVPKKQVQKSSGIGLENLKLRYQMMSDLPVVVENRNDEFVVKILLLKVTVAVGFSPQ